MKDIAKKLRALPLSDRCEFTHNEFIEILDSYAPWLSGGQLSQIYELLLAMTDFGYIKGQNRQKYLQKKRKRNNKKSLTT